MTVLMECRACFVCCLTILLGSNFGVAAPPAEDQREWEQTVAPFLKQHCYACHDAREARAGFRIDELNREMLDGNAADHWLEVMNSINLGVMPPAEETRPDAEMSFAVVRWIAKQLQRAEQAAAQAGGRIPMRRLNRDEFGNTVRDLLLIDEKHLTPIVAELPGDGRAEGFDRLGAALFFDQTQIASTLSAAERISALAIVYPDQAPQVQVSRFEAEDPLQSGMGIRPPSETTRNRFSDQKMEVAAGPATYRYQRSGVVFLAGNDSRRKDFGFSRVATKTVDDLISEDGYYRIRIRCGMDRGTRDEPIRVIVAYNFGTPQEKLQEIEVTAPLSQPETIETVMFIRRGADDQRRKITLLYNDLPSYTVTTEEASQFFRDSRALPAALKAARDSGDEAAIAKALADVAAFRARAAAWKGPAQRVNPRYQDMTPPQLYLDWMELEGPLHEAWPPASHQQLLFAGDDSQETIAQREAEFARRASVLDSVLEDVHAMEQALGTTDRAKLDEYLTGIRDLEAAMQAEKSWLYRDKPEVEPVDFGTDQGLDPDKSGLDYRRYQRLMFDVITLALQTDSTRVVSYMPRMDNSDGTGAWRSEGNPYGYHTMTHHGEDADKLKWFTKSDILYMEQWAYFLNKLKSVREGDGTLLDHSLVTWGSTGGTINAHNNHHLPAILCGGTGLGIQHQGHLVKEDQYLGNLWQTVFQALQVPTPENFQGGQANGVISELL